VIRIANIDDLETIVEYNYNLAKESENLELNKEQLFKGVTAVLTDNSKGIYYVYEINNQVVGQLMITYEWSDWRNANIWWIQSVYVHKEYRRNGIFKALFDYVNNFVSTNSSICDLRLYVDVENKSAQSTYQSLGMIKSHYYLYELKK